MFRGTKLKATEKESVLENVDIEISFCLKLISKSTFPTSLGFSVAFIIFWNLV